MLTCGVSVLCRAVFLKRGTLQKSVIKVNGLLEGHELRSLIILSLICQIILVYLGDHRKYSPKVRIRALTCMVRVWVLWAASSDNFKDFVLDLQQDRSRIMEEYKLKEIEGYKLIQLTVNNVHKVMRTHVEADLKSLEDQPSGEELQRLVDIFKGILADLLLSFEEYATSRSVLKGKNFLVVFRVIEFELSFLYDLLYTKALVIYSRFGLFLRFLSISVTLVVLILFTHKNQLFSSSMFDINLTYALLVVALLLEIYALYGFLLSDWTACWLINHKWFGFMKLINWFRPLHKSVSLKEKQSSVCHRVLRFLLGVDEMPVVQKHLYKTHEDVNDHLKEFIFKQLARDDQRRDAELPSPWSSRGIHALKRNKRSVSLKWSIELEFDESIIIWHIATEICYHFRNSNSLDNPGDSHDGGTESRRTISKCLSRYMAYLLVMHPSLLPSRTRRIKYQDTYATGMRFFEQHTKDERHKIKMTEACDLLLRQVENEEKHTIPKGQTSKFLWYNGCRLASKLHDIANEKKRWTAVSEVWVKMLAYAASKCDTSDHAQQLRRGGELLTHVWFPMTHFGLTDYFKLQNVPAIADMIVK
ncbi:hypothetical protein BT93_L0566 [Corymbia citriodora subsp. variegata]|uniref:DUF4220 domain-containing protein n=1 Tax=Corymbia citriodora subsp. variegata TaxID=360336 RepID=A0A8T0CUE4_CORYI|nr:hypothetical protein BT93_L0566 [Corymbia citriodora subsp. variegata]